MRGSRQFYQMHVGAGIMSAGEIMFILDEAAAPTFGIRAGSACLCVANRKSRGVEAGVVDGRSTSSSDVGGWSLCCVTELR